MNNINGEVLGNLFRSTQQLAAFGQFLAQMALQGGENEAPQRREEEEEEKPEAAPNPGRDGPRLILPSSAAKPKPKTAANIGRNDPCPCGSGKKYKQCCGRMA